MTRDRVFLVGFMGAGKSTVGPMLAESLGWPFIDLDSVIEASFGGPIHQIFESQGEASFRQMETDAIKKLDQRRHCVVALGGGAFAQARNRVLVKQLGLSVFLNLPLELILKRCPADGTRPLLQDRASVEELYASRLSLYRLSDFEVDASLPVGRIVDTVLEKINS